MYSVDRLLGGGVAKDQLATIDHPLEHLAACHDRLEDRLKVLERAVEHWEDRPAEAREALAASFRYFESSGVTHTEDEEQSVFPRLEGRISGPDAAYLASLEAQHREADAIYAALKHPPESAEELPRYREVVRQFAELYRAHIASENERLIAVARAALTPEELAEISSEMKRRRKFL